MTYKELMDSLDQLGDASALDAVVHELKSEEASGINNGGFSSQVSYLKSCDIPYDEIYTLATDQD